jgi:hypothetical protein
MPAVSELLEKESEAGLLSLQVYKDFQGRAEEVKLGFLDFLIEQKKAGKLVGAYGAAAKGNTLMNFAGVKPDLLPFVVDAAPSKQGKFMPGSHLPILAPDALREQQLDFVVILPWNIADEVRTNLSYLSERGTRFVTAIPEIRQS